MFSEVFSKLALHSFFSVPTSTVPVHLQQQKFPYTLLDIYKDVSSMAVSGHISVWLIKP